MQFWRLKHLVQDVRKSLSIRSLIARNLSSYAILLIFLYVIPFFLPGSQLIISCLLQDSLEEEIEQLLKDKDAYMQKEVIPT